MKRWSTREVARLAGVSPATVSRVVNHNPSVAPELAGRVLDVVRGLEQDATGQRRRAPARKVGVAFPRRLDGYDSDPMGGAFYGQVLSGIDDVLRDGGHDHSIFPFDPAEPAEGLVSRQRTRFDGLILMGADTADELAREAARQNLPVIVVDKQVRGVDSVVSDNTGDLGLAGFDDVVLASRSDPPLTTVRVDKMEMGRLAARRLIERIGSPDLLPITITMHVALTLRSSTQFYGGSRPR